MNEETQYIDKDTRESVHSNLGMFVLVLMSHGGYGTIAAKDGNTGTMTQIKLVDIYRLLSSRNFPAMRGKPKMVILQACSGGVYSKKSFTLYDVHHVSRYMYMYVIHIMRKSLNASSAI